jgi:ParB family chromosome partitioning protein
MATKKRPVTKSGKPRARRGVKLTPTELGPTELRVERPEGASAELASQIEADGGQVLTVYREPLGGHTQLIAALPIEQVEPTPYQRDVSDAHVRRLTLAMDKTRRYLDPIIAVRSGEKRYFTPNGNHRLTALKELGARTILALVVAEPQVAYQILALNIEKAHNLREKSLEVVRMHEELAKLDPGRKESDYALEFEEAPLITLGYCYRERGRFSGGAYHSALKKVDAFLDEKLGSAKDERERRASKLMQLDDAVSDVVARLKERGMTSPYLRAFVVARVNPLRFMKGAVPSFDELLDTMTKRARGMNVEKIKTEDLARSGGAPDED